MKDQIKINKISVASILEYILLFLIIPIFSYLAIKYSSGPRHWDDLWYVNTAYGSIAEPDILNRYFLIYLCQLFIHIAANDPIAGSRLCGGFLFTVSLELIYLISKMIARRQKRLVGIFSVLFMLTFSTFVNDYGVALADYAVNFTILLGILVFVLNIKYPEKNKVLFAAFGFISFLAFKSKETGLLLALLIPSFVSEIGYSLTVRKVMIKLCYYLAGVFAGLLLFVVLDGLILKKAFFSIDPSSISALLKFNTRQFDIIQDPNNNFINSLTPCSAFLFSMVWIFTTDHKDKARIRWLFVLVLGIVAFLNISLINGGWPVVPSYLAPVLSILSILAPQLISDHAPEHWSRWPNGLVVAGISLIVSSAVTLALFYLVGKPAHMTFEFFTVGLLVPTVMILLLAWLCVWNKNSLRSYSIFLIGVITLTVPVAAKNIVNYINIQQSAPSRYLPFAEFKDQITCSQGKVLISATGYRRDGYLSRDQKSSSLIYDIYFKCHKPVDDFSYAKTQNELYQSLLQEEFDQVFLVKSDMQFLQDQSNSATDFLYKYQINKDTSGNLFYLSRK